MCVYFSSSQACRHHCASNALACDMRISHTRGCELIDIVVQRHFRQVGVAFSFMSTIIHEVHTCASCACCGYRIPAQTDGSDTSIAYSVSFMLLGVATVHPQVFKIPYSQCACIEQCGAHVIASLDDAQANRSYGTFWGHLSHL